MTAPTIAADSIFVFGNVTFIKSSHPHTGIAPGKIGFGAVSVAAMTDVAHRDAGLASGLMTTAHELGAALGVAALSAVAAGDGLGDAFAVAAGVAAVGALAAIVALPSVRPEPGVAHPVH